MADVKFMALSENENPATTDYVLTGNSTDGVKRASLANIGKLFQTNGILHTEEVTGVTVPTDPAKKNFVAIEAPVVEGYTFAFWINSRCVGNTLPISLVQSTSQTTGMFVYFAPGEDIAGIGPVKTAVTAVYVKSEKA